VQFIPKRLGYVLNEALKVENHDHLLLVKEEKVKKVSAYTMNSSPPSFSFMAESQSTFLLNIFKGIKVKERCQVPVAVTLIR